MQGTASNARAITVGQIAIVTNNIQLPNITSKRKHRTQSEPSVIRCGSPGTRIPSTIILAEVPTSNLNVNETFSSVLLDKDSDFLTNSNATFRTSENTNCHRVPPTGMKVKRSLSWDKDMKVIARKNFYKWSAKSSVSSYHRAARNLGLSYSSNIR